MYICLVKYNIYIYIYIYITYTNLPVNVIVRLPRPWSGDSQGSETFYYPLLTSKPASMTQISQTPILPYQPKGQRD